MSLSEKLTSLMTSARKYFEVTNKLSIADLINLFNPNKNLINGSATWENDNFENIGKNGVTLTNESYKVLKVVHCALAWSSPNFVYNVQEGKTYTFSTYAKGDQNQGYGFFSVFTGSPAVTDPVFFNDSNSHVTTNWQRYSWTFKALKDSTVVLRMEQIANGNLYLAGYKLEEGILATPLTEVGGSTSSY